MTIKKGSHPTSIASSQFPMKCLLEKLKNFVAEPYRELCTDQRDAMRYLIIRYQDVFAYWRTNVLQTWYAIETRDATPTSQNSWRFHLSMKRQGEEYHEDEEWWCYWTFQQSLDLACCWSKEEKWHFQILHRLLNVKHHENDSYSSPP